MKYNKQSADILSEADRFERILNWQLFCAEQNARLFGPAAKGEWMPGDAMYKYPEYRRTIWGSLADIEGNWVRPMFQEMDDIELWYEARGEPDCKPCEVYWEVEKRFEDSWDNVCWSCGYDYTEDWEHDIPPSQFYRRLAERNREAQRIQRLEDEANRFQAAEFDRMHGTPVVQPRGIFFGRGLDIGEITEISVDHYGIYMSGSFTDMMRRMIDEETSRLLGRYNEFDVAMTESIFRGLSISQVIYDEAQVEPYHPPTLQSCPFVITEVSEQETPTSRLYDPRWRGDARHVSRFAEQRFIEAVAAIDISVQPEIPMPNMPELRPLPEFGSRRLIQTQSINQQRRNRDV